MDFDIFGRNITNKVDNQKLLYYATSNNLCFCTTWQNVETQKSHFFTRSVLHCLPARKTCHEWILIFFGRNVTNKVDNQKLLYSATSNNLCFCTTWQNVETQKSHFFSLDLCYTVFLQENLSSVMCLRSSDIC